MFQCLRQRKGQKQKPQPLWAKIQGWVRLIMDFITCVYLVLMTAVMPLYFRDGYTHIATDKADFCARVSISVLRLQLPLLAVYLAGALTAFLRRKQKNPARAVWLEQLGKIQKRVTLTDLFMGVYGAALILSYLCSDYKGDALWGAVNGWYMGFMPQLMLVAAYFFIAKCWKPRRAFFYLMLSVSAAVFLLGYLNRFGFYPVEMKLSSPGFISTIGNINWYCGYLVTVLFAGAASVWRGGGRLWQRVLLYGYVLLGFATMTTQGSMSGIVALGAVLSVLLVMSAGDGGRMCRFWAVAALLSAACLFTGLLRGAAPDRINLEDKIIDLLTTGCLPVIMTIVSLLLLALFYIVEKKGIYPRKYMTILVKIFVTIVSCAVVLFIILTAVNTKYPGSLGWLSEYPAFTFSYRWGSNRGATWRAGLMCFSEQDIVHKLTGVGPDAMSAYIYQDGSEGLLQMLNQVFGPNLRLTNTHNEWLTVLVDTGILGLIGFGGAMVTAMAAFFRKSGESGKAASGGGSGGFCSVCCACGFSLLAYTVNNMFSFQQTVSLTTMIAILGMGMAFLRAEGSTE